MSHLISFPCNTCRTSFHFHVTHAAPHFISAPNLTSFEFPALHGWACAHQSNEHSYGSHLVLIFTFYWCCTSSSPTKGSTTLRIYEGDKCIFYLEYIVTTKELFALDIYMQNWASAFITCFYSRHYIEWQRQTKFVAFFLNMSYKIPCL